jgi:hypothetical protein
MTTFLANKQLSELIFPDFTAYDTLDTMNKVCEQNGFKARIEYEEADGSPIALVIYKHGETRDEKEHTD